MVDASMAFFGPNNSEHIVKYEYADDDDSKYSSYYNEDSAWAELDQLIGQETEYLVLPDNNRICVTDGFVNPLFLGYILTATNPEN
jgi:nuclear transport factor 2 (NTF2) superfamily protein